jgi:hypothetical protein
MEMSTRKISFLLLGLGLFAAVGFRAQQPPAKPGHSHAEHDTKVEEQAVTAMTGHAHHGAHLKLTGRRPLTQEDQRRAEEILATLRQSLEKYKDYRVAISDGYQPFLANLPLPEHHFTNYRLGAQAAFLFDAAQPTSLLYRRTKDGWELTGAMYTAARNATEDQLHERVPLSLARWHAHVNICLPQPGQGAQADWTKFGPQGSITTSASCEEAGGRPMKPISPALRLDRRSAIPELSRS